MKRTLLSLFTIGVLSLSACGSSEPGGAASAPPAPQSSDAASGAPSSEPASSGEPTVSDESTGAPAAGVGAWEYGESAEGAPTATITTDGAELVVTNDEVWGATVYLQADDLTAEVLDDEVCRNGCKLQMQIGDEEWENLASRPETDGAQPLSLRDPYDLWEKMAEAGGTLTITATDEHVYDFDVTGADPEFL